MRAEHRGEVTLINRSPDSAQRLVEELPDAVDRVRPWRNSLQRFKALTSWINTVPVEALTEMVDWTDGPELHSSSWLELSYGSEAKRWGERLAAHGWKTIDGRRVLVHQACILRSVDRCVDTRTSGRKCNRFMSRLSFN